MPRDVGTSFDVAAEIPYVAVDAIGNAVVVWYQYDGTRYHIWANRLSR